MNNKRNELSQDKELKSKLIDLYIHQNLNQAEVAKELNISLWMCKNLLNIWGIKKSVDTITEKRKQTNLEKYGVDNPSKTDEIKNLISLKNKENKEIRVQKTKQTKKEKYNNENYNNVEKGKLTKKIRYNNENYNNREKCKQTFLEHYGVENIFQTTEFIERNKQHLFDEKNYSDEFKRVFDNKEEAIKLLNNSSYSYYDLTLLFNAPYYVVQMWATRLEIKSLINMKFEGKSHYEDELVIFLNSLGISNIIRNSKDFLDNQEIDLYLPDYKIGLEFNGTFWHSDLYKDSDYHYNKSLKAQQKGIRLIHIYEYEWLDPNQKEKIKDLIRIATGKIQNRIYAKNCDIRLITNQEAKILNEKNHLQGHRNAKVTYGLFYKGELVQLMSFSHHKKYQWEIVRGCPSSNNIVIGGVSKLFKHFIEDYNPDEIFSYSDFNKFDGNSYEKLGMKFIGYTGPDMKYMVNNKVINRQPSRYKEIKSQIQYRIFGSGSKKYLWKKE